VTERRVDPLIEGDATLSKPDLLSTLVEVTPEGGEVQVIASGWRLAVREFADNKVAVLGLGIIVFFVLFSFVGPLIYKTNQSLTQPLNAGVSPGGALATGGAAPLGTDQNGFDELGRLMLGGRAALEVGFYAAFIATVIGTLFGAVAGLAGRLIDGIMMRFVDIVLSIPFLLIVLVIAANQGGATITSLSLLLGLFSWLVPARLVRGEVLTLRERDFVWAARVMGSGRARLVYRHLIPNALSVVIVNVTFLVADSILALAFLGFLGFGLQYPQASWGDMLGNADQYVQAGQWWLVYPVGFCLVAVVMACNLVGDALRDAFDVRLRRR
jgi:ABC-type dipeptide/oligopeptide/nickel transport system permease subunit